MGLQTNTSSEWRNRFRLRLEEWDRAVGLDPEQAFFAGWEEMPSFDFSAEPFRPVTAWWLAELSRLAYTPDERELGRPGSGRLPCRRKLLKERSPFSLVHSVHTFGNHASIYRKRGETRGAIVCFRGTSRLRQWLMNTAVRPHAWRRFQREGDPEDAFVHSGFYVLYKRIWPRLAVQLEAIPRPWIFAGHSLGGALATIAGVVHRPDLVCTFGAPRVGNARFAGLQETISLWRIVNDLDVVPRLPVADPRFGSRMFVHGGELRHLDREGGWRPFREDGEETSLASLFPAGESRTGPPVWLRDHRMGEYCRKLRRQVAGSD